MKILSSFRLLLQADTIPSAFQWEGTLAAIETAFFSTYMYTQANPLIAPVQRR